MVTLVVVFLLVSTIDRLEFATETVTNPPASLTQARAFLAAVQNSSYGYFGGGTTFGVNFSTIDRIEFSTETVTAPAPKLTQARSGLAAVSAKVSQVTKKSPTYTTWRESANFGYYGGGCCSTSLFPP
jgi:hypothetical protein